MKTIKNSIKFLLLVWGLSACSQEDKYSVANFMDSATTKNTMKSIIPYIAKLESGVNYENRFDTNATRYFEEQQSKYKFSFERYCITKDSVHYFLIWKVAPSLYQKKIAIGGRYKKDASGKIYAFEEIFNTPKMPLDELKEKSFPLFDYMVEHGDVEKFYGDYLLIEFPDGKCMYDKEHSKWILTDNPRWVDSLLIKH